MGFITQFWRQIQADKAFSLINLAGLTVAITCSLLIFTYVSYHYSFNHFHEDSERIYRLLTIDKSQPNANPAGMVTNALIPTVRDEIPEVELAARFEFTLSVTVRVNERIHYLEQALLAEPEFFQVFNFPPIAGESGTALDEPNTVVVSQSFARQLFGDQEPIGQVVNIFNSRDMRVVGVFADMPANSHIQSDLIISMRLDPAVSPRFAERYVSWRSISMQSYIRLYPGSDPSLVEQKIQKLMEEREESGYISVIMQPLDDIHLHSQEVEAEVNASKEDYRQMYVFIGIAVLLMTIAVCNYINLSTAKAVTRAKEVGIRKTVGASRSQLIVQFLAESLIMIAIATLLSLILIELISPWIAIPTIDNQLDYLFSDASLVLIALAILLGIGLVAGIYPALVLSSQKMMGGLKGSYAKSKKGIAIRRGLVVMQMAISTIVIIALFVINAQIGSLQRTPLGFNAQNVVHLDFREEAMFGRYDALVNELNTIPEIVSLTNVSMLPGLLGKNAYSPQEGARASTEVMMGYSVVDASFIPTLQINLVEGENFNDTMSNSELPPVIVNQAAARAFEWSGSPIGKVLRGGSGADYRVVGLLANTRFSGPQHPEEPYVLHFSSEPNWVTMARIAPESMATGLEKIRTVWERIYPDHPFEYVMLSDRMEGLLGEEVKFASQLFEFTFIAMFIACLGLYGHATFSANQNLREMGIRKVFGASDSDIFKLIVREYGALMLIANVIAWPIAFILVNRWLTDFANPIDAEIGQFLQAALIVVALGSLAISATVLRVIRTNPVFTLRHE